MQNPKSKIQNPRGVMECSAGEDLYPPIPFPTPFVFPPRTWGNRQGLGLIWGKRRRSRPAFLLHAGAWCLVVLLCLFSTSGTAAEIRGTVKDFANGNPVQGAKVTFPAFHVETATDTDGRFRFTDLSVGTYAVTISAPGYHTYSFERTFADSTEIANLTVELKPSVAGETTAEYLQEQPRYNIPEVTVTTTRAKGNDPVTYTNLNQKDIQQRTYGQDLPLLLTELPNVVAYSDGGNGIGYSYLRMRGFPQSRVAVEINGTPLNDAGDGEVFWIDLPDFAEDLQDMQVQRGVGSSLYGPAAFGGTINVVTRTPGLNNYPTLRAEGTYGAFNTRRAMVMFDAGRIQDKYGISGRLTRMSTDGYRDQSWAELWSYYLSAARFGNSHTTRVVFYGGPEKTHLAYDGATLAELAVNRKYNPLSYPGETDNFFQPHYEIHDEWKMSSKVHLDNSLYLFRGDGFYDQYREGQSISDYFYSASIPDSTVNLLRRRNVGETDWGWIPRMNIKHGWGEMTVGGELRIHQAHHEGQLVWSSWMPEGVGPDYRYYDYRIRKNSGAVYVHNLFDVTKNLSAMMDLQARVLWYYMDRDRLWNVHWGRGFGFGEPRIGLNYQLLTPDGRSGKPAASVYGSYSVAGREPAYNDIFDPQSRWDLPDYAGANFEQTGDGYKYVGPSLKPESMQDIEVGTNWQWVKGRVGVNLYLMRLHDELIWAGGLDNLGRPIIGNADLTKHDGIEFTGAYSPLLWLKLSGNLALTNHRFVHYKEWTSDTTFISNDGKRLAMDPPYVMNVRADVTYRGFFFSPSVQAIGKQFIDNTETDSSAVKAYALLNLDFGYRFTHLGSAAKSVELRFRLNNLLNAEYKTAGWWGDVDPVYIVGAPRAAYSTLRVDF
jgi:iron complex outermembrane receptor protein